LRPKLIDIGVQAIGSVGSREAAVASGAGKVCTLLIESQSGAAVESDMLPLLRDWLDRAALITERQVGEVAEGIEILVDDGLLGVALGLVLAAQLDDLAARRRVQIGALRLGADSADILGQFSWPRSTASAIDEIAQTVAVGGVDAVMADGGARRGWHRGFGPAGHGMHS
jgi:hypothetical protein